MIGLPHIAERVFDSPLLIDPRKAAAFAVGLGARICGETIELVGGLGAIQHQAGQQPLLGRMGDRLGRAFNASGATPYDVVSGVAVIPIEGTLVHKGAWVGQSSGQTSYQGIITQARAALRDPAIRGVVLEVDSYGGEAAGAFDAADEIAALSAAKPTLAILTTVAASGGYLLAAAARRIVAPPEGMAGSIGVLTLHADISRQLANDGVQVTMITSGAYKAEGAPLAPLAPETRQRMQARADRLRADFAARVAGYRAGRLTTAQVMATEARTFDSEEALSLRLIDAVGKPDTAFEAFISAVNERS